MVVAAVLMLSRTVDVWSVLAAVGAVVATLTLVRIAVVRRIRPEEETRRIDTSLQVAYMDAAPVVREAADRAQREVLAELGPERAAQVVRVRTAVVDEVKTAHPALAEMSPEAPAGGFIIEGVTAKWLPLDMTEEWRR